MKSVYRRLFGRLIAGAILVVITWLMVLSEGIADAAPSAADGPLAIAVMTAMTPTPSPTPPPTPTPVPVGEIFGYSPPVPTLSVTPDSPVSADTTETLTASISGDYFSVFKSGGLFIGRKEVESYDGL